MSIYTENGYASREEYLDLLRIDYGSDIVNRLISKYPPSEDFGQLIIALEEYDTEPEYDEEEEEEEEEDEDDFYDDEF